MSGITRRGFLESAGAAAATAALPLAAEARLDPDHFDDQVGKLYDATRCIGCRSCLRACREAHDLNPEPGEIRGVEFDMPRDLSPDNLLVIQAHSQEAEPESGRPEAWSFFKKSCMHCNLPACVSVCPVAALEKTQAGPVVYHEDRCIGCRYCLLACPYGVPRYEWIDRMPRVRKCDMNLACVRACPVEALATGSRREMIDEAHRRIHEQPGRYVDHVYGEQEAGGTGYLILAGLPFERLGLPALSDDPRSSYADAIMGSLPGLVIGLGLFLGGLYQLERRQSERHEAARAERLAGPKTPARSEETKAATPGEEPER